MKVEVEPWNIKLIQLEDRNMTERDIMMAYEKDRQRVQGKHLLVTSGPGSGEMSYDSYDFENRLREQYGPGRMIRRFH